MSSDSGYLDLSFEIRSNAQTIKDIRQFKKKSENMVQEVENWLATPSTTLGESHIFASAWLKRKWPFA